LSSVSFQSLQRMAQLVIQYGAERRTHRIIDDVTTIGRSPANTIQVPDIKLSREHCRIERAEKGYRLVDLDSQNGTTVNGLKVSERALRFGDSIQIGSVSIVLEREPGETDSPTVSARHKPARRRYRRPFPMRRRLVVAATEQERTATGEIDAFIEKFRGLVEDSIKRLGPETLDTVADLLDEFYIQKTGSSQLENLVEMRNRLLRLQEINKLVNSEQDVPKLLEIIMDAVVELTSAERGFLILPEDGRMNIRVARNFDKAAIEQPEFKFSHSIAERVISSGETVLTADAVSDERLTTVGSVSDLKLRSVLCVPFKIMGEVIGCIYMDNTIEANVFSETDMKVLESFADQAAVAIRNARLAQENIAKRAELQRSSEQVEKLNRLLEEKVEKQAEELAEVKQVLKHRQGQLELKYNYQNIVAQSRKMREIFHVLDKITDTDVPVLIEGESGTGKELVARAIHFNGARAKRAFVSQNCAAIPETLLESELFGHARGAFTGADREHKGLFEIADGGTLFLDEIADMSLEMQKKLLRALQEGEIRRVGGKETVHVDVRIISASNKDLKKLMESGRFREDLYYRLNVIKIGLPPLRERREDIPLLVSHFLDAAARDGGGKRKHVDPEAMSLLAAYGWPGNVRELENELRRAVALSGERITTDDLKDEIRAVQPSRVPIPKIEGKQLKDVVREAAERVEKEVIAQVLRQTNWVKTEAAHVLGISRPTLDAKIEAYGLKQ
jgi:transcriptional regulator with GAF, ATPase, and Fis domain